MCPHSERTIHPPVCSHAYAADLRSVVAATTRNVSHERKLGSAACRSLSRRDASGVGSSHSYFRRPSPYKASSYDSCRPHAVLFSTAADCSSLLPKISRRSSPLSIHDQFPVRVTFSACLRSRTKQQSNAITMTRCKDDT